MDCFTNEREREEGAFFFACCSVGIGLIFCKFLFCSTTIWVWTCFLFEALLDGGARCLLFLYQC
jgi:hypothetical protein